MSPKPELLSPLKMLDAFWERGDIADVEYNDWEKEPYRSNAQNFNELIGLSKEKELELLNSETAFQNGESELGPVLNESDLTGLNLKRLLETINDRLLVLLTKDHTIGHAWLMNIWSLKEL